jgi:hypothetical protein
MANILYIPQLSMYDKKTGKYLPAADGNLNMMKNFINEWLIHKPYDSFGILLPDQPDVVFWFYDNISPKPSKIFGLFYNNHVISARINRFNFPMKEISNLINPNMKIDLVINDVPELSRNIIAMFEVNFGYSPKIMSNIHHMDDINEDKSKYNYFLRVFDAIECSDYVTILSESMRDMLYDALYHYLNPILAGDLYIKTFVFEPSVSAKELDKYKSMARIWDSKKKIITFPGRLSKGEERRTNWDVFLEAIQQLRDYGRDDFEVYLTDPNNSANFDKQPEWLHFIEKDRDQFLRLLHKTDIIVSLMNIQGFGGISIREALQFNCYPVIPYKDEYKLMAPSGHNGFVDDIMAVNLLIYALNTALDEAKPSFNNYGYAEKFTIEYQMPELLKHMESVDK